MRFLQKSTIPPIDSFVSLEMISGATGALAVVMVSLVSEGNAMGTASENLGAILPFFDSNFNGIYSDTRGSF